MAAVDVRLTPRQGATALAVVIAALALAHGAVLVLTLGLGYRKLFGLAPMFHLAEEANVPTYVAALILLAIAGLLALAGQAAGDRQAAWQWRGLAVVAAFLSVDEAAVVHDLLVAPTRTALHTSGALHYAWVVPYAALVLLVGLACLRFLARLPRATAVRFVVAAAIFVGGAIGMELVEGALVSASYKYGSLPLELALTVEELLELVGAAYFVVALLRHLEGQGVVLRLAIGAAAPEEPAVRRAAARR